VEQVLVDLLARTPMTDLRWQSRVIAVRQHPKHVEISIDTPQGPYSITADYLIAADGSRSQIRSMLGLEFVGEAFRDHFLIADVRMQADRPAERWFWFDPPFAPSQSALLHKQPDGIWRLDFQLGWNIDRDAELDPERVKQRVRGMLGSRTEFELEWVSLYTFQCRQLERFVHDRVIFAGDAAHLVSPFGARGANGGVQDIDNLCWKLGLVLQGIAPAKLLDSYDAERVHAARENLLNSTRSTDFITPKTTMSRAFRDAVLELARHHEFARRMVNSGRLSTPAVLSDSPLNPPGSQVTQSRVVPGAPAIDAPVMNGKGRSWFLRELAPQHFTLVIFGLENETTAGRLDLPIPLKVLHVCAPDGATTRANELIDVDGRLAEIADASPGTCLLYRPDQHLAARWNAFDPKRLRAALTHCIGRSQ
jgi:3-(3-hydroxy-phenyl)propionate hydroxylase